MKLEEFYKKLRELSEQYPGTLVKAVETRYGVNSILGINNVLIRHLKAFWIRDIAMACVLYNIIDPLLLGYDKIPDYMLDRKSFIEALNNLSQEDFDKELDEIVKVLKEFLRHR
jgi:hypothetical protein